MSGSYITHKDRVYSHHPDVDPSDCPSLRVLNFSGGRQSSALLWMVLRGDIKINPTQFVVMNADPGMENTATYAYVELMKHECEKAGIEFVTAPGPNLYEDMIGLKASGSARLDSPSYWTTPDKEDGKAGRLRQKCTKQYKIAPMDRAVRRIMMDRFGLPLNTSAVGRSRVEKWIGFSYDEVHRMSLPGQQYVYFRYPLIEMRLGDADVADYFERYDLPMPPRSVCNACFANGVDMLKDMHDNRPGDWDQAVAVDESVRDWSQIGVRQQVYVSHTLIPLRALAERNFEIDGEDQSGWSCDSGYCFA